MKKDRVHITETPDTSDIRNEDITHEVSDVNTRGILWFVLVLALIVAFSMGLLWGMYRFFESMARQAEGEKPPMARSAKERQDDIPGPRLQAAPGYKSEGQNLELREPQAEMKVVRKKWEEQLSGYGWVDQSKGIVHIPIEQAKRLIVERGIQPAKPQSNTQQTKAPEETQPTEPSSGRAVEKRQP